MRLYKYISPILLMLLVTGICVNGDSAETVNYGGSYDIDSKMSSFDVSEKVLSANELEHQAIEQEGTKQKGSMDIVQVAYKEVGNIGGEKFWSWYGFSSYQPWCACFVSWCADQCGYIEKGIIPKFSLVANGAKWFKDKDQWLRGYETPKPGMLIFFDFVNHDLQNVKDGISDHVGLVKNVADGYVYCIEGNYKNTCQESKYVIGASCILGYGAPNY